MSQNTPAIEEAVSWIEDALGSDLEFHPTWSILRLQPATSWTPQQMALTAAIGTFFTGGESEPKYPVGTLRPFHAADQDDPCVIRSEIGDVEPAWLAIWAEALPIATLPILKARLTDLLWEARYGERPVDFACQAAASYAEAASSAWDDSPVSSSDSNRCAAAVRCLRRARDLARAINLDAGVLDLPRTTRRALDRELGRGQSDLRLPVATDLFEICESVTSDADLGTLSDPLARILSFATDSLLHWEWQLECELALAKRRNEPAEAIVARHVRAKLAASRSAENWNDRMRLLRFADEQVSRAGDSALSREVRRAMEDTKMPMAEAKFSVSLPAEAMEAMMAGIVRDDSAVHALKRLAFTPPIGWSDEQISAQIREMSDHAQFLDLVPLQTFDVRGNATSSVATDEQRPAFKERWIRTWLISFSAATITGPALAHIRDHYRGNDGTLDLAGFFAAAWTDQWIVDGLCRAFEHHFNGLHEEAALLALRRIEWIARDLLNTCGGVTTTPMQGERPGGVKGLGEILRALRGHLDPDFATWLDLSLTNSTAINLRGRYFHALRDGPEPSQTDAALALQAVLYLWRDRVQRNAAAAEREDPDQASV